MKWEHIFSKKSKAIELNRRNHFSVTIYLNAHKHCATTLSTLNPQCARVHTQQWTNIVD